MKRIDPSLGKVCQVVSTRAEICHIPGTGVALQNPRDDHHKLVSICQKLYKIPSGRQYSPGLGVRWCRFLQSEVVLGGIGESRGALAVFSFGLGRVGGCMAQS